MGVSLRYLPASDDGDNGGNPAKNRQPRLTLGARLADSDGGIKVLSVTHGSAADKAGLAAGDVIVAIDGLRARMGKLQTQLTAIGERSVEVHAFRLDELMTFDVTPQPAAGDTAVLEVTDPDKLKGWLEL
ncbi:PDZ domain-containing protein [Gallaecimonas mangrovi]|uniref:PDZ domain-containing protein n=1 Tax=Gallaecimonas mangrovi TaxID=2291597 RepID=UPI00299F6C1A|nr:PDZ domain-containing protein [Gallaecimonas mangrovi]